MKRKPRVTKAAPRAAKAIINTRQAEISTVASHLRTLMSSGLTQEEHEDLLDALELGPLNTTDLLERVEKTFHMMDGPPNAFFELPVGDGTVARFVYVTVRFGVAEAGENAVRKLCNQAWDIFEKISLNSQGARLCLFWRIRPAISESFGRTSLRMRLVIPGADLSGFANPEGGEEPML